MACKKYDIPVYILPFFVCFPIPIAPKPFLNPTGAYFAMSGPFPLLGPICFKKDELQFHNDEFALATKEGNMGLEDATISYYRTTIRSLLVPYR